MTAALAEYVKRRQQREIVSLLISEISEICGCPFWLWLRSVVNFLPAWPSQP